MCGQRVLSKERWQGSDPHADTTVVAGDQALFGNEGHLFSTLRTARKSLAKASFIFFLLLCDDPAQTLIFGFFGLFELFLEKGTVFFSLVDPLATVGDHFVEFGEIHSWSGLMKQEKREKYRVRHIIAMLPCTVCPRLDLPYHAPV